MSGKDFLDILCGSSTIEGLLDKNPNDIRYRVGCLNWLNLVLKDISTRQNSFHWLFLEKSATAPTVVDQHTYDPPIDIDTNKMFAIYDRTKDRTYKFVPYSKFVRYVPDPANYRGDIIIWTFFANTIRMLNIPTSVFTMYMDFIKTITLFSDNATSFTDIPAKYDSVILNGALVYGYRFDPELGDWEKQQAIFEIGITNMVRENSMMIAELPETQSHRTRGNDLGGTLPIDTHAGGIWA